MHLSWSQVDELHAQLDKSAELHAAPEAPHTPESQQAQVLHPQRQVSDGVYSPEVGDTPP